VKYSGLGLLTQQAIRQAIWEVLNRHQSKGQPDIALIGSRRSGSTLLMQVIAHHKGMKSVDQPFAPPTATSAQMKALGHPPGGMFIAPSEEDHEKLKAYIRAMQAGDLHVQEPWRFWRKDFHFRSDRLVLKTTNASYLAEVLAEMGLTNVLYFRHPIPQSLSCARNKWGDKLALFARHEPFVHRVLNTQQRNLLTSLIYDGAELDRYVLGWCLENMPLFAAHAAGTPTVFYEDLVKDPDTVLQKLAQVCDIHVSDAMRAMVGRASVSVRNLSDPAATAAIQSGDTDALIGRWRQHVTDADLARVQGILDLFEGCVYRADTVTPLRVSAQTV
tara:strand:+ start:4513 stop:5505 length:993 start_codon:yes stop_codon:yes gene_type:complete